MVEANALAKEVGALEGRDEERNADIVDEQVLQREGPRALPSGQVLVEGHLAHDLSPDLVILLRCHPDELRRRLESRDWSREKVEENVMAETLNALASEIQVDPTREVDTTGRDPSKLASRIMELFRDESLNQDWLQPLGANDWSDTLVDEEDA